MSKMTGLYKFIVKVHDATSKQAEAKHVNKELAHIRKKFSNKLNGYNKKKYVWKLLYIYMIGYDVDFGHMIALNLITSNKFSEKNAGYMTCSILLNEKSEFLRLIIQSIKRDLVPEEKPNEFFQCLALSTVANVGGQEFAESLSGDVIKLLLSSRSVASIRKKAALCLLRLIRKYPDVIPSENFAPRVVNLMEDNHKGVLTSVMSLILGLVSHDPTGYEGAREKAIKLLGSLAFSQDKKSVYKYYVTVAPWLQVKLLRLLQYFPPPTDTAVMNRLHHCLNDILTKTQITENPYKNNADHAILFEAINLIMHLATHGVTLLHAHAVRRLSRFILYRTANLNYLGLEAMTRLAKIPGSFKLDPDDQKVVSSALQNPDVSIRKRAIDLLFYMCNESNYTEIVSTFLKYLQTASMEMREELVLKIAILAERNEPKWYVDVVLQLISIAGDFVSDDIWFRVIQVVTNQEELQDYAATTCYKFLQNPTVHPAGVKVGAYVLGEFGHQIQDESVTGMMLFETLASKWPTSNASTKAIILNAFIKMANTYPEQELLAKLEKVFEDNSTNIDAEVQQRAVEYATLFKLGDENLMTSVFEVMPDFNLEKESALSKRAEAESNNATDRDIWSKDGKVARAKQDSDDEDDEEEDSEDEEEEDVIATDYTSNNILGVEEEDGEESDYEEEYSSEDEGETKSALPTAVATDNSLDLFGFEDAFASAVPTSSAFPVQGEISAAYKRNAGNIYTSDNLTVDIKMASSPPDAKIVLYVKNPGSSDITDFTISGLPDTNKYAVKLKSTDAIVVAAGGNAQVMMLMKSKKPDGTAPVLTLSFTHNSTPVTLKLTLPVPVTAFTKPQNCTKEQFIKTCSSTGNEIIQVLNLPSAKGVNFFKAGLTKVMHLAVIDGVDPNPNTICACGIYNSSTVGGNGRPVTMPIFVKLETKPTAAVVRVVIRTGYQTVTDGVLFAFEQIFNATKR